MNARLRQHSPLVVLFLGPSDASEHQMTLCNKFLALCVVPLAYSCEYLGPFLVRNVGILDFLTIPFSVPASAVSGPLSSLF